MEQYPRVPQTTARRRRTERNADAYFPPVPLTDGQPPAEPSMQAPQPMPAATTRAAAHSAPIRPVQQAAPQQTPSMSAPQPLPGQQTMPQQQLPPIYEGTYPPQAYPYGQPLQPVQPQQGYEPGYPPEFSSAPAGYQAPPSGWTLPPVQQEAYQGQQSRYQSPQNGWQPPAYPAAPENMPERRSGGGEPPPHGMPTWLRLALLALAVIVVLTGAVLLGRGAAQNSALREEVTAYNNRFCEGVYVDGIHLGGMTQDQALQTVMANAQQRRDQWNVRLTYQGALVRTITANDLGMTINVDNALNAAWEQGHQSADLAERKAAMDALRQSPYHGSTALPSGNTAVIDSILQQLAAQVYSAPMDAQLIGFDPLLTYPFTIQESVTGRSLNITPTKNRLYQMAQSMESGSVELELIETQPAVTSSDLRAKLTLRGTAYTEISTTSTQERTDNIRRAFELISGKVIRPGETFSFNGVVGERSAKNGFFPAIEYAYGEEREGYGGGICQASTTIYLAAVRANMEITRRTPHSDKVNYTEYGLDATVYYDGKKIDLVFRNNTDSPIYIKCSVQKDPKISKTHLIAVVEIWGESLGEGITYDLIAETREILPAPTDPEYREDKKGEYVTYIDEEYTYRQAKEGCIVDSFKVKYVNGAEVDRTFMYEDTYAPKTQVIYTGIKEREDGWIFQ